MGDWALADGPHRVSSLLVADDAREEIFKKRKGAQAVVDGVRGEFLTVMIDLEAHLDRAIVYYFAPDELPLFVTAVLERLNFVTKISIVREMLKAVGLHDAHRKAVKEMDDLRAERNRFAHVAFEFVGNSFLDPSGNYRLYRKSRLDPGAPLEADEFDLIELRRLVLRARRAESKAFEVEREITDVHAVPEDYFYREGWDPLGHFPQ